MSLLTGRLTALAFTTAIAIVASACASSTASAPATSTSPQASVAASTSPAASAVIGPADIEVWWTDTEAKAVEAANKALDAYEEAHPGVSIERSFMTYDDFSAAMPAALAAGNPPDFVYGDPQAPNAPEFVKAGQLVELSDIINERGWKDRIKPGVTEFYNPLYGGGTYGIPLYAKPRGIFYNKTILQELGGQVPTTLEEFDALLAKAKAAGYVPLGMGNLEKWGVDLYWLSLILGYLAPGDWETFTKGMMSQAADVPWGGEAVRQATAKLLEWRDKGYFNEDYASVSTDVLHPDFLAGKMLAVAGSIDFNGQLESAPESLDVGFMNWPQVDAAAPLLTMSDPGQILMLPKDSKNPDVAIDVMDWLLSQDVARIMAEAGLSPNHQFDLGSVTLPLPLLEEQLAAASEQTIIGWFNYMAPFEFPDRQGSEMQKLLAGDTTLDEFIPFLQQTYDSAIAGAS